MRAVRSVLAIVWAGMFVGLLGLTGCDIVSDSGNDAGGQSGPGQDAGTNPDSGGPGLDTGSPGGDANAADTEPGDDSLPGCVPDCAGKGCGEDGCGGSCGDCGAGMACFDGQCEACTSSCDGIECGNDGCGGSCGTCDPGTMCEDGACIACTPDCGGKACGDDGCGGSCGECGDALCQDGVCVTCEPNCEDRECGNDGCGGTCGTCGEGDLCIGGSCETCAASCDGKECGDDGCGSLCGTCSAGYCVDGNCQDQCAPDCGDRVCGPDGCGGSCGTCSGGQNCGPGGTCVSACAACSGTACPNYGFEQADWPYWNLDGDAQAVSSLGAATPIEGQQMALVSTGLFSQSATTLSRWMCSPGAVKKIRFHWKAYSEEFTEYCGSQYQDILTVALSAGGSTQVFFQRTVDNLCPTTACETCGSHFVGLEQADVSFDQGDVWMTGWQQAELDVAGFVAGASGGDVEVRFYITDVGDSIYDTAFLLDAVELVY